jgi:hypothetical protein
MLNGKVLVSEIAGQRVTSAENVDVVRGLRRESVPLKAGARLADGDLLLIRPEGMLEFDGKKFKAPGGMLRWRLQDKDQKDDGRPQEQNVLMVRVTSPDVMLIRPADDYAIRPPMQIIQQLQEGASWLTHGSSGRVRPQRSPVNPDSLEERRRFFHGKSKTESEQKKSSGPGQPSGN